jgi:hypothetical protein
VKDYLLLTIWKGEQRIPLSGAEYFAAGHGLISSRKRRIVWPLT